MGSAQNDSPDCPVVSNVAWRGFHQSARLGAQLDGAVETARRWAFLGLSKDVLNTPTDWLNRLVAEAGTPCVNCESLAFPWQHHAVDFDPSLKACSRACATAANEAAARDRKEGRA